MGWSQFTTHCPAILCCCCTSPHGCGWSDRTCHDREAAPLWPVSLMSGAVSIQVHAQPWQEALAAWTSPLPSLSPKFPISPSKGVQSMRSEAIPWPKHREPQQRSFEWSMRRENKPVIPTVSFGERNRLYFPSLSTPVPWKIKASVQRASGTCSEPGMLTGDQSPDLTSRVSCSLQHPCPGAGVKGEISKLAHNWEVNGTNGTRAQGVPRNHHP